MQSVKTTYTSGEMIRAMLGVSKIVKSLNRENFKIHQITVGNGRRPEISLFHSEECDQLIESGVAHYIHQNNRIPVKIGIFERNGCRVTWSQNSY